MHAKSDTRLDGFDPVSPMLYDLIKLILVIGILGLLWLILNHTRPTLLTIIIILIGSVIALMTLPEDDALALRTVITMAVLFILTLVLFIVLLAFGCYGLYQDTWTRYTLLGMCVCVYGSDIWRWVCEQSLRLLHGRAGGE